MRSADRTLPGNPWIYFLWMAAGNACLSYAGLPSVPAVLVFVLGVLVPAVLASLSFEPASPHHGPGEGGSSSRMGWIFFILLLAASAAARFVKLTTLSAWPNFDEGVYSFAAIEMMEGRMHEWFFGNSQAPPGYIWALEAWYKAFGVSLFTTWLLPAVLSLLFVPAAWWAARVWMGPAASRIVAALAGLSFWPLYLGRYSLMTTAIPLFEALALGALGWFLKGKGGEDRLKGASFLGAVLGAGFYVHLHWLAIAPVIVATVLYAAWKRRDVRPGLPFLFAGLVLLPLPLVLAALREGYGKYFQHLMLEKGPFEWGTRSLLAIQYLASLFWGVDPEHCTYQPVWGGFLNPVLGALCLMGMGEAARRRSSPLHAWLIAAFLAWLLPGILTDTLETFRLVPLIPVLFAFIALGWGRLKGPNTRLNAVLVLALLAASFLFDAHHLYGVHARRWDAVRYWKGHTKSLFRARAYQALRENAAAAGPGFLFSRLVPGLPDPTLEVAAYSFNAADNEHIRPGNCRWAAFLGNVNQRWYFKERFPQGKAYALDREGLSDDGGWMLFVTPLDASSSPSLDEWVRVHRSLKGYLWKSMAFFKGLDYSRNLPELEAVLRPPSKDPLLHSLLLELVSDARFKVGAFRPGGTGDVFKPALFSIEKALKEGLPFAHLYYRLGQLRLICGERNGARQAFAAATRCPEDFTRARQELKTLGQTSSGGKKVHP